MIAMAFGNKTVRPNRSASGRLGLGLRPDNLHMATHYIYLDLTRHGAYDEELIP
jgi:hypothetical protein